VEGELLLALDDADASVAGELVPDRDARDPPTDHQELEPLRHPVPPMRASGAAPLSVAFS
jgi:hypothetical protein